MTVINTAAPPASIVALMHYPASELVIDPVLMRKYDTPAPRYTCYPTEERFVEDFGEVELTRWLARRHAGGITQPLSVFVHLPFVSGSTIGYLDKELALVGRHLGEDPQLCELAFGAGTFRVAADMSALMAAIDRKFVRTPGCACSIEVDPRQAPAGALAFLAGLGFNRVTFGMQDFERTRRAFAEARENGFRSVGLCVLYGQSRQTLDGFNRSLGEVLDLDPDRIALSACEAAPSAELKLQLLTLAIGRLTRAGYLYIGLDHFARPDDELALAQSQGRLRRNFQGYSTHRGDVLGFGISAKGRVGPSYYQDHEQPDDYCAALDQDRLPVARGVELSQDDLVRGAVIESLTCHFRVSIESIELAHLIDFPRYFATELAGLRPLAEEGLVEVASDWIVVTAKGRMMVHVVCMLFDRYLSPCTKA